MCIEGRPRGLKDQRIKGAKVPFFAKATGGKARQLKSTNNTNFLIFFLARLGTIGHD